MFQRRVNRHRVIKRKLAYVRFMQLLPEGFRLLPAAIGLWWNRWIETILLNMVWIVSLFLFPVLPPVTFGVFYALRDPDEIDNRLKVMWEGIKKYLGISYLNALASIFVIGISYLNWAFYNSLENVWFKLFGAVSIVVFIAWCAIQFYLIPIIFQQEEKNLWLAYRNAASLFFASPFYGTLNLALAALIAALSVLAPPLAFFGSPIILMLYSHFSVADRLVHFKAIQPEATPFYYDPVQKEKELLAVYEVE